MLSGMLALLAIENSAAQCQELLSVQAENAVLREELRRARAENAAVLHQVHPGRRLGDAPKTPGVLRSWRDFLW